MSLNGSSGTSLEIDAQALCQRGLTLLRRATILSRSCCGAQSQCVLILHQQGRCFECQNVIFPMVHCVTHSSEKNPLFGLKGRHHLQKTGMVCERLVQIGMTLSGTAEGQAIHPNEVRMGRSFSSHKRLPFFSHADLF